METVGLVKETIVSATPPVPKRFRKEGSSTRPWPKGGTAKAVSHRSLLHLGTSLAL